MRLVGLNGFTVSRYLSGRIDGLFTDGIFPFKRNWAPRHKDYVKRYIPGEEPYLLTGFSDGGTLAHEVAHDDPRCAGLMVHSSMFRERRIKRLRNIPILLMRTIGDKTPTFDAMQKAHDWYYIDNKVTNLEPANGPLDLPNNDPSFLGRWLKHEFSNGLPAMAEFTLRHFGFVLPVAERP